MSINAIFRTSENRGDHAADIYQVFEVFEGETVECLIKRCNMTFPSDVIELKIVKG